MRQWYRTRPPMLQFPRNWALLRKVEVQGRYLENDMQDSGQQKCLPLLVVLALSSSPIIIIFIATMKLATDTDRAVFVISLYSNQPFSQCKELLTVIWAIRHLLTAEYCPSEFCSSCSQVIRSFCSGCSLMIENKVDKETVSFSYQ